MEENCNNISSYVSGVSEAEEIGNAKNATVATPAASGASASGQESMDLHIQHTNFEPGFRALSPYVRRLLFKRTKQYINMQCERSGFAVDRDYWIKVLEQIINTDTAENALIADARAGYGKSTFINALVLAMIAVSREKAEYRRELGGMIVSLQKVEDLNRLVKLVAEVFGDTNNIVAIQGWTESGKAEGFCKNPDVTVFEQCDSKKCPYAFKCPLLSFQIRASTALIVCVTHVRFRMYLDSPTMMNTILIRQDEFMFGVPRRYILFDENPHLDRTAKLSLPLIHKVSNDLNAMCRSNHISERMDRCLQSKLSFSVQGLYQKLRGQEGIYPPDDSLEQVEAVAGRVSVDLNDFFHGSAPTQQCLPSLLDAGSR